MATAAECIDRIKADAPELSDDDLVGVIETLNGLRQQRTARGELDDIDAKLFDDAERIASDLEMAKLIERRNAADNVLKLRKVMDRIGRFSNDAEGLEAINVGSNERVAGARQSVDAAQLAEEHKLLGGMIADLRREGVLEIVTRRMGRFSQGQGTLDLKIAQEMWELDKADGRPGISNSKEAQTIAGIFHKYQDLAITLQNRSGAHIRRMPGYIMRQSHESAKLARAGYETWRRDILPRLDPIRTFQGRDQEEFLERAYDALKSGDHIKQDSTAEMLGFKGPANLAKQVSQNRVLHFKSAEDWYGYNELYGRASVVEGVVSGLRHAAHNVALMNVWGTNPRAMYDRVVQRLRLRNKKNDAVSQRLRGAMVEAQFRVIDGSTRIPNHITGARVAHGWRAIQTMAKLGGAVISSITDLPLIASELRHQGENFLTGYALSLENAVRGRRSGEARQIADLIGAGTEGMVGDMNARFSSTDMIPGTMSKLVQRFMKLNLLGPWTDSHKTGVGLLMARRLAQVSGESWGQLGPRRRASLTTAGIEAAEWDVMRAYMVRDVESLGQYLMPDFARGIPDEALAPLIDGRPTARRLNMKRDELETKLLAYYADRIEIAVLTPGARETAILTRGTRPGTVEGEALRFIGQFKAFPLALITKVWGREIEQSGFWRTLGGVARGRSGILQIAGLMVQMTALGYVAQSAKEMAKGRTPRDPASVRTWIAAFTQGGGAGLYGDFLFGEFNRFGGGLLPQVLGPTAGTVEDFARAWAGLIRGEDVAAQGFQLLKNNTPFLNLFYTRIALDYLFFYQLQEMMNPGYLRRMERRIERDNGQTFLLPPSREIPRGGGDQLLEGVR